MGIPLGALIACKMYTDNSMIASVLRSLFFDHDTMRRKMSQPVYDAFKTVASQIFYATHQPLNQFIVQTLYNKDKAYFEQLKQNIRGDVNVPNIGSGTHG